MVQQEVNQITLPERLVSSVDLSRTLRELQAIDESLRQAELRRPGEPTKLARSSTTLEDLARVNNISLTDKVQREQLIGVLKAFNLHAPRIHVSVAVEPSAAFIQRITLWMRTNINPVLLIEIGLQPTLAAGCMIRTNNKIFDMSLRHRFAENHHLLFEKISEVADTVETKRVVAKPEPSQVTAVTQVSIPAAPAPADKRQAA